MDFVAHDLYGKRHLLTTVDDIVSFLVVAKKLYYKGDPSLSDSQFDRIEDELRKIDPTNDYFKMIGNGEGKIPHGNFKMLSLSKLSSITTTEYWMGKILSSDKYQFLSLTKSVRVPRLRNPFVVEWKYDGVSLKLRYYNGQLIQALTRGNGSFGEDVTIHAVQMPSVPKDLNSFDYEGMIEVVGEAIMSKDVFDCGYSEKYANPRNLVAGLLNRNCTSDDIKNVDFVAYGSNGVECYNEEDRLSSLRCFGFKVADFYPVVNYSMVAVKFKEMQEIHRSYEGCINRVANYEVDGIVIKVNELEVQKDLGDDGYSPNWATCVKFESRKAVTVVEDLIYTVGQTGKTTFMLKVSPVNIGGTVVRNVSVNSWRLVKKMRCGVGSRVLIERAGDVIPHLYCVLVGSDPIKPKSCRYCGGELVLVGAHLYCHNRECRIRVIGKLSRWIGVTGVKYWGGSLMNKLYESGIRDPLELYSLTPAKMVGRITGISLSRATKLIEDFRSKKLNLFKIIAGLGYEGVGSETARRYSKFLRGESVDFSGLSADKIDLLNTGKNKILSYVEALKSEGVYQEDEATTDFQVDNSLDGLKFCFTGKMSKTRAEMHDICRDHGGLPVGVVKKGLDYLVQSDPSSLSSKSRAAKELGVEIISEEEFINMSLRGAS